MRNAFVAWFIWLGFSAHTGNIGLANDSFDDRITLEGQFASATWDNTNATLDDGETRFGAGATLWWQWVSPGNGYIMIDTAGSAFTPAFRIYRGLNPSNLELVGENTLACPFEHDPPVPMPNLHDGKILRANGIFPVERGYYYQIVMDSPLLTPRGDPADAPRGLIKFSIGLSNALIILPLDRYYTDSSFRAFFGYISNGPFPAASIALEIDGVVSPIPYTGSGFDIVNPPPGYHRLRTRVEFTDGHVIHSPSSEIVVKIPHDDFARAFELSGPNPRGLMPRAFGTLEPGEPTPIGDDTYWAHWKATSRGVARLEISSRFQRIRVFRGTSLASLEFVAANDSAPVPQIPNQPSQLLPFVQFATETDADYYFQFVTERADGLLWPECIPPQATPTSQLSLALDSHEGVIGPLDIIKGEALVEFQAGDELFTPPFIRVNFAALANARWSLETSADFSAWTVRREGVATGGNLHADIAAPPHNESLFLRIRVSG